MNTYEKEHQYELLYLEDTLSFIRHELEKESLNLDCSRSKVISARRDMWQEAAHFSNDFDKIPEMNQYLFEVNNQVSSYDQISNKLKKYKQMLDSPYFGRFDFQEAGYDDTDKIYIGLYNLIDNKTDSIYVYDWRSPIASIYYQHEVGRACYNSPTKIIYGDVLMKRQYKILNSELKYFFDSNLTINDEILQDVLSQNSSTKMKNIVETIQKEQDIIIRDAENELLIVQGVAGSGKTSIALHRIAFLLYRGMGSKISSNNVIIVSPNSYFSKYISGVLPELGENNVEQITFDDIAKKALKNNLTIENRSTQLENLISLDKHRASAIKLEEIKFKGSLQFVEILDRLIRYYEHHLIPFEDIYYDNKIIMTKQEIKNLFLNNKIGMSITKRLKRIENIILDKIHPLRKTRLCKIENIVQNSIGHELEIKSFSRLLSIKETKVFINHLHKFTQVDYFDLYKTIFNDNELFYKLSKGLTLPEEIKNILLNTKNNLNKDYISYEDCSPLIYLKLKLEDSKEFSEIKQVIIDEAQDYYPIQYAIFNLLFCKARYTVLGDFNQSLEKRGDKSIYDDLSKVLCKNKSIKLFLNKSYRSSTEINNFSQKILNNNQEFIAFERHEAAPKVVFKKNKESLYAAMADDIAYFKNLNCESIAVICKTQQEADEVYNKLKDLTDINLFNPEADKIQKNALVIPAYMSKGLEFDAVLVYNTSEDNYSSDFDRRILYIACTRALHQLALYYTGNRSSFI